MKKPRVFIINESGHDFEEAKKWGDLVFLTEGHVVGKQINKHFRIMEEKLRDFSQDDYLICTSLQILNFIAGYIIGWRHIHPIHILYYQNGSYISLDYDFSALLEKRKEVLIRKGESL